MLIKSSIFSSQVFVKLLFFSFTDFVFEIFSIGFFLQLSGFEHFLAQNYSDKRIEDGSLLNIN